MALPPETSRADGPGRLHATALLTDGLADCLTAAARPAFSWQLAAAAGGDPALALQTGYELVVEDARGAELWASGPVPSARQRGVPYEGPALDGDADYAWRVRLRDAAGVPGAWSAPHRFSTGLADGAWDAQWIRRAPGGRAPLEVLDGALRVAGTPFLPVPVPPLRTLRLQARIRPVMGWAGIILRSSGPGTGLLLELNHTGGVVLRPAPEWEIPAQATPGTPVLASGSAARNPHGDREQQPGNDPAAVPWQDLEVADDGTSIRVSLAGRDVMVLDEPLAPGATGRPALHQGPRSQAEYGSLRIMGRRDAAGPEELLLEHRFDAGGDHARACLAHWPRTTSHRQPDEWTLFRSTVKLTGTVRRARLYVAAHHHAQVSLAGTPCLSTTSFGYPGEGYYDAADVTALLADHPGVAPVPLTALLHWYGPGQGRAAGKYSPPARTGPPGRRRTGSRATATTRGIRWSTSTARLPPQGPPQGICRPPSASVAIRCRSSRRCTRAGRV